MDSVAGGDPISIILFTLDVTLMLGYMYFGNIWDYFEKGVIEVAKGTKKGTKKTGKGGKKC